MGNFRAGYFLINSFYSHVQNLTISGLGFTNFLAQEINYFSLPPCPSLFVFLLKTKHIKPQTQV